MTRKELYVFRDPNGIRPLSIAMLKDGSYVAASESCALDLLGVEWKREVKPGEIICLSENGIQEYEIAPQEIGESKNAHHCIFEHIYFSRPDSFEFGQNVYEVRKRIGSELADNDDIEPDVVVPVPDSANFIALGYAERKHIPYEMGLIRNHYVGRTFIKPDQTIRDESVYQKFNPLPNFFDGKKVLLVDDSIVRGTTLQKIVKLIRFKGAKEIHLRIGSPPIRYSCFYGIDTPTQQELIAHQKKYLEIIDFLGVDSLMYMSLEMLKRVVPDPQNHCFACFDGNYPVKLDADIQKSIEHKDWDFSYGSL